MRPTEVQLHTIDGDLGVIGITRVQEPCFFHHGAAPQLSIVIGEQDLRRLGGDKRKAALHQHGSAGGQIGGLALGILDAANLGSMQAGDAHLLMPGIIPLQLLGGQAELGRLRGRG